MTMSTKEKITVGVGVLVVLILAGFAGASDLEDAQQQEQAYCENVTEWYNTDGEYGWPDYNENYSTVCAEYVDPMNGGK